MSATSLLSPDLGKNYEVVDWRNALSVLVSAHPVEWADIQRVLRSFKLLRSEIETPGGDRSPISRRIDSSFYSLGWREKKFNTAIQVDGQLSESPTHSVDCFKGRVALEVEWNNKDPFYDRDLNNFRLLFELRAIDVGVIITRASELQLIFNSLGKGKSYGNSTTHLGKLTPRLQGGSGGGCPVLVFAIKPELYVDDLSAQGI